MEGTARKLQQAVFQIAKTTQNLDGARAAVEGSPGLAIHKARIEPPVLSPPVTDDEIEVAGGQGIQRDGQVWALEVVDAFQPVSTDQPTNQPSIRLID